MTSFNDNGGPPITDDAPRLRVVRVHINDWVASTRGMSLDEEGFFWRFTCLFYDRMGDLPDDDAMVARAMNLDVRRYRHMKEIMVRLGKVSVAGGRLSNARAEREIAMYVAEFKRRSEAAIERETKRRNAAATNKIAPTSIPTSPRLRPDFDTEVAPMSDRLRPETKADLYEKDSNNNECAATTVGTEGPEASCARAFPKPKPKPLSEVKNPHTPPMGGPDPLDQAFEDFWRAFPAGRKQAKPDARSAFRKIVTGRHRKGLKAKAETIIAAAAAYAATSPDPDFVPMPSTWLNSGRWEDDLAPASAPSPVNGKSWGWWKGREDKLKALSDERWNAALDSAKPNGTWPWWLFGPPPGAPDCLVPQHIVDARGWVDVYRGSITHA